MKFSKITLLVFFVAGYFSAPSSVLGQTKKYTFSGSGVLHYNDEVHNVGAPSNAGELDLHRIVFKGSYSANEKLVFKSKLKIEHLFWGTDDGEVIFLDQAYMDYKLKSHFGIRAGLYSVPLGGSKFKPSFGLESAPTDKYISYSWRELTAGVYGEYLNKFSYEAYIMSGLHVDELSTKSGLYNARKSYFGSSINTLAAAGRVGYQLTSKITVGTSAMISGLQSKGDFEDRLKGANYKLVEGHIVYNNKGFNSRLVGVYSSISEIEKINAEIDGHLGSSQYGALLEAGYDLFQLRKLPAVQQLFAYARAEIYDTHLTTKGFLGDPEKERYEYTFGVVYKPLKNIEFEVDYQLLRSRGLKNTQQLNMGIAYSF